MLDRDQIFEDETLLTSAVREAGTLAMSFFGRGLKGTHKPDNTPVSEADLAVDRLLHERLTRPRPSYGWLSEETADNPRRLEAERVWIVDPIDGTRAFLAGLPEWTVAAALVEDGQPRIGVVYNPATDEMFTARRGAGAFLNRAQVAVRQRSEIEGSCLIVTKGFFKHKVWTQPWPRIDRVWVNSIAYRLALIAAGRADGTLALSAKSEWDLAAAVLLVQEAGGKATDANGAAFRFNQPIPRMSGLVAAAPALHELLVARTRPLAGRD